MSKYGLPYMGSKAKIAEKVCFLFPRADHFYDLFGGGFSITHCMLKNRPNHFKEFHFNELRKGMTELISKAIAGDYNYNKYKPEWISREDFFKKKGTDLIVKILWSFGNNGNDYLFGKEIEDQKRSLHMAIVFNEFDIFAKEMLGMDLFKDGYSVTDKRLLVKNRIKDLGKKRIDLEQLQQLQRLEQLQQLEQLEQLEQLQRLFFYNEEYQNVIIKPNSVVYCDPPYEGTGDYGSNFNTEKFLDWANSQTEPVFISEYEIKDARFKKIANFDKRSLLNSNKDKTLIKNEGVWVNRAGYIKLLSRSK